MKNYLVAEEVGLKTPSGTVVLDNSGNLGIGTATPSQKLDVNGISFFRNDIRVHTDATIISDDSLSIKPTSGVGRLSIAESTNDQYITMGVNSSQTSFIYFTSGLLDINSNFYMGITGHHGANQSNPLSSLHVKATSNDTGGDLTSYADACITMEGADATDKWAYSINNNANALITSYNLSNVMFLDTTGNLTIDGAYSPFTGQHKVDEENIDIGMIVKTTNATSVDITTTNVSVSLTNVDNDKSVFGVMARNNYVNSVGDGSVWICNKNGNLTSGDYITTSTVAGYGVVQNDDILHNYTVAKILTDCDFSTPDKYIDANGNDTTQENSVYKAMFVPCTYHCG